MGTNRNVIIDEIFKGKRNIPNNEKWLLITYVDTLNLYNKQQEIHTQMLMTYDSYLKRLIPNVQYLDKNNIKYDNTITQIVQKGVDALNNKPDFMEKIKIIEKLIDDLLRAFFPKEF